MHLYVFIIKREREWKKTTDRKSAKKRERKKEEKIRISREY